MQGFNHVAGGVAFAGIFASFVDVNIFEKPEYLAVTALSALLADVDHTRSLIGKMFYPLARWIDRKYGHRTVTHSLLFFIGFIIAVGTLEQLILGSRRLTMFAGLGYGSHLIFDMCTRQGIPLFMPFTTARCVLPGNPKLRLSNKNIVPEIIVFFSFSGLILTTMPLMSNGFWTTYNKAFGTFKHLQREQNRTARIIEIKTKEGISGDVVEATGAGAMLWTGSNFVQVQEKSSDIQSQAKTARIRQIQRIEFVDVSADSVRGMLSRAVIKFKAASSQPLRYRKEGQQHEQPSLELQYVSGFDFFVIEPDDSKAVDQVEKLQGQIVEYLDQVRRFKQEQQARQQEITRLQSRYNSLSEYEQGKAIEEFTRLRQQVEQAKAPEVSAAVDNLRREIERVREANKIKPATFTGVAEIWRQ
jgi:inner membrane protein